MATIDQLRELASTCCQCGIARERLGVVPPVGAAKPKLVIVLGGPPTQEDLYVDDGLPAGWRGKALHVLLRGAGLTLNDVLVMGTAPCVPKVPITDSQFRACGAFFGQVLMRTEPKAIVALGLVAFRRCITGAEGPIERVRGKRYDRNGIPMVPTWGLIDVADDPKLAVQAVADIKAAIA